MTAEREPALEIGEGAFGWKTQSAQDANAALIAATGCAASELIHMFYQQGERGVVARVAMILCKNSDEMEHLDIARIIDADAQSSLASRLRMIVEETAPKADETETADTTVSTENGDDDGDQ